MRDLSVARARRRRSSAVSLPTLYAYVSRGLIRSEREGAARRRRYLAEDVWLLNARKRGGATRRGAAQDALHWGMPVLESRLSVIHGGRLYYAGRDAVELAARATIEQVAALLWSGDLDSRAARRRRSRTDAARVAQRDGAGATAAAARGPAALPAAGGGARSVRVRSAADGGAARRGAASCACSPPRRRARARRRSRSRGVLQRRWAPRDAGAARLLDAALVLYADNGLNPSSFTARCVASAGSTPYAVVAAGLAALQGVKHGGACERAAGLLDEVRDARGARPPWPRACGAANRCPGSAIRSIPTAIRAPRTCSSSSPRIGRSRPRWRACARSSTRSREAMNERPTIDFAVVALCRALGLPAGAPLLLLGVARVVGWIAHGLEQYREGREIRPRAALVAWRSPAGLSERVAPASVPVAAQRRPACERWRIAPGRCARHRHGGRCYPFQAGAQRPCSGKPA